MCWMHEWLAIQVKVYIYYQVLRICCKVWSVVRLLRHLSFSILLLFSGIYSILLSIYYCEYIYFYNYNNTLFNVILSETVMYIYIPWINYQINIVYIISLTKKSMYNGIYHKWKTFLTDIFWKKCGALLQLKTTYWSCGIVDDLKCASNMHKLWNIDQV